MEATDNTYDVRVRIEDTADIYVGEQARAAMQADALRQLDESLREAREEFGAEDFDQTDLKRLGELTWPLSRALAAAKALQALAPLPPDDEDDA